MAREFRVLQGLKRSQVPHAKPLLLCEDSEVIGAPFYIMSFVDGIRLYDGLPASHAGGDAQEGIGRTLVDTLASIHNLDVIESGLIELGMPENFTQRQVTRWMKQLETYRTREIADLDAAISWLSSNVPTTQRVSLIHGDYGLHNVLYKAVLPVSLVAVVDWETATVGDPLMDLGYLMSLWLEDDEPQRWTAAALPYDTSHFPKRKELMQRYQELTGLELSEIDWYRAMAQVKVACILEGGYTQFVKGGSDDPHFASYKHAVLNHAAYALAITRGEE